MALVMRSTPFCTPSEQMRMETTHTTTIQKTHSTGEASIASKTAEVALRVGPHELPGGELRHVGEHPPGHRGVEHHEQIAPGDAHPLVLVPVSARRLQHVEGAGDGALGTAAHSELHDHDGQAQDHQKDQVHDEEGRASVLAGDVGEAPDVAEAYGAASGDEDEPQTAAESLTFQ